MTRLLEVTEDAEQVVAEYLEAVRGTGLSTDKPQRWGARYFFDRFKSYQGWADAPIDVQLSMNIQVHRFVAWLLVTHRMAASAGYLVGRRSMLGELTTRYHPTFSASFTDHARELGYPAAAISMMWNVLAQSCALHAVAPDELTQDQLDATRTALCEAAARTPRRSMRHYSSAAYNLEAVLFHLRVTDQLPRRRARTKLSERIRQWQEVSRTAPQLSATCGRYLEQIGLSLRPGTVKRIEGQLREFACFLVQRDPEVHGAHDVTRRHIEEFKLWLSERPHQRGGRLHRHTIGDCLGTLRNFFERIVEWDWDDAPPRVPVFAGDRPIPDEPLPRFLDDAAATKLLQAARRDPDPFSRLAVEFLARTGLRKGEFLALTVDAVVQIGSAYWLRVPVGKLHTDRYIPLHPQLKELLDSWLEGRPSSLRSNLMFVERGRPIVAARVDQAVHSVAQSAGIGHVSPHQLRHTLATQAINRGMSLEAIAALLGHRSLSMTMVYARIADRTVANEYFAVSEKVEALYNQPKQLPAASEGGEMRKLRSEMHRRMLGNGYCSRPLDMDCHFESICESCQFFVTTIDFKPTLERQRDDATKKGQIGRQRVFERLLSRLEEEPA